MLNEIVGQRKRKILMLSDHQLSTSGVGTQSRWLINGLISTGRWSFRCFGGAIKHENYETVTVNPDFIIKPTNGFGDRGMLRTALAQERPDVLLLFTDPRFFTWIFEIEDEVHNVCPIAYNHLWDNEPWPEFNRVIYESTDLLNCINWPTYKMVKERFPEKTNYIPHAVPQEIFFKMSDEETLMHKKRILGADRADHFIATFVSRNARRKMPSDIIVSFKMFLDDLHARHGHKKATLVLHTDPHDPEGPNLHHVISMLDVKDNVVFSKERIGFQEMNFLYNMSDVVVNRSCAEGFGLSTLEAMMAGTPIIVLKTGGLSRQVEDEHGNQYGIGLEPEIKTLVGNQLVPFIYEDHISHATFANAITQMYDWGRDKRKEVGLKAMERARKDYSMKSLIEQWDTTLTKLCENWESGGRNQLWSVTEI